MPEESILIIDDEPQIRKLLSITLQSNNYRVFEASTGEEGINAVSKQCPALVLLDLGLQDISGYEVLKHLRDWFSNPIIIISVLSKEDDIVKALDYGANDYVVKPFRTVEILARIRAALKKTQSASNVAVKTFNELTIDFANRIVKKDGSAIDLTRTEYALLSLLAQNDGKVLTHQYLLNQIWGPDHLNESQYLKVFVSQLRKKVETDPNRPVHIITESGIGYRFIGNISN